MSVLSEKDVEKLVLAFVRGSGDKGVTEGEVVAFVEWCEAMRTGDALVDLLLDGKVKVEPGDKPSDYRWSVGKGEN